MSTAPARLRTTKHLKKVLLLSTILAIAVLSTIIETSPAAAAKHSKPHCNRACIVAIAKSKCLRNHNAWHCRIWHRWQSGAPGLDPKTGGTLYTTFNLCVANREAGSPGATTYSTVQWAINTRNGFTGGYQFADDTWRNVEAMMGITLGSKGWTAEAWIATPDEQTAAFNYYEPKNPYAWPNTVPACGGP